ncbi:hypothetical protein OIU84_000404 [Salix udensis]|uniref:Uncharacterized protein n=1 Tax=Salix udensis TaxID=889485 RepID=A0AAD6PN38_9ROSI|nr:hypothetical protein OIU84_000404 [Salix udensis]
MDVTLILGNMFESVDKCIINFLGAVVRSRLVMEVHHIQCEEFLANRPLVLRSYR